MSQTTQDRSDPLVYPRHETYWITGGDLHVLVGGIRFRVHSYFLRRDSIFWKSLIDNSRSQGVYGRRLGSHESVPLVLDEDPQDFARFLWIFYNPRYNIYTTTLDQWVTILRLATRWDCPTIRQFAISHIDNIQMEPVEKIRIYKEYTVPRDYFLPIYFELATRERGLERELFHVLDDETLFSIVTARGMILALPSTNPSHVRQNEETNILATAFDLTPQKVRALRAARGEEDSVSTSGEVTPEDPGPSDNLETETGPDDDAEVLIPTPEDETQAADEEEGLNDQGAADNLGEEWHIVQMSEVSRRSGLLDAFARVPALHAQLFFPYSLSILFMCAALA